MKKPTSPKKLKLTIEVVESGFFTDSNLPEGRVYARANVNEEVYSKPVDITEIGIEGAKLAFQRGWEDMLNKNFSS